jgi:hypothetical protein
MFGLLREAVKPFAISGETVVVRLTPWVQSMAWYGFPVMSTSFCVPMGISKELAFATSVNGHPY